MEAWQWVLQLLEKLQSDALPPRTHALVRAEVAKTKRTSWANTTIDALLARHTGPADDFDLIATKFCQETNADSLEGYC
jgi:hypothetical protein